MVAEMWQGKAITVNTYLLSTCSSVYFRSNKYMYTLASFVGIVLGQGNCVHRSWYMYIYLRRLRLCFNNSRRSHVVTNKIMYKLPDFFSLFFFEWRLRLTVTAKDTVTRIILKPQTCRLNINTANNYSCTAIDINTLFKHFVKLFEDL